MAEYYSFYNLKLDTKEDILAFVKLCKDYCATSPSLEEAKHNYSQMCTTFCDIVRGLANKTEALRGDFERIATLDKVPNMRKKADEYFDIAVNVLQILPLLPFEYTSQPDNVVWVEYMTSSWAKYAVIAKKMVSDQNAQKKIFGKEIFMKMVPSFYADKIENKFTEFTQLTEREINAVIENRIAKGNKNQAKLIQGIYNHRIATPSIKQENNENDIRQTTVLLIKRSNLWLFLLAFAAPFIGFYVYDQWYMFFCMLLVAIIQLFPFLHLASNEFEDKVIEVSKMQKYVQTETTLDLLKRGLFVLLGLLNIFPFLAANQSFMLAVRGESIPRYELGTFGIFCTVVLVGIWFYAAYNMPKPEIHKYFNLLKTNNLTFEEKYEIDKKEHDTELSQEIAFNEKMYGKGYVSLGYGLVVNNTTQKLFIDNKEYNFADIVNIDIHDNTETIHTSSTSTITTDNSNMIKRAVVGGLLFGQVGAVVGGATAKKNIEHTESKSTVIHDYTVVITINDIYSPTKRIKVGNNANGLDKIVSTISLILNKNKKSNS